MPSFPFGKLDENDEGEVLVAIGTKEGAVVINYGKPVLWVGLYPAQARELAAALIAKADAIDKAAH